MIDILQAFITQYPITCLILFGIASLMMGSVLSMVIYRLPIIMAEQYGPSVEESQNKKPIFNLFLPRSHCGSCKTTIPAYHNIPLFSYIFLKGRCASCHSIISWRYPTVEILTLILSLAALYRFGTHLTLLWALSFIWLTICLAFIDLEHQLLPDNLTLSLLWIGLLVNTQALFCSLSCAVWSAAGAYMSLWLLIKVFYLITGKIGMGHGDFKLFAAFGAWFGWTALPHILLWACVLGSIVGLAYLRITKQDRHTPIPFGPYLCLAGLIQLFFNIPYFV